MPNLPISGLPVLTGDVGVTDPLVVVQGGVTYQTNETKLEIAESQVTNLVADLAARLTKAANLSDVSSVDTSLQNIGLGAYSVTHSNQTSNLTLFNPLPLLVIVEMNAAGHTVKLPVFNASKAIYRFVVIRNSGTNTFALTTDDGTPVDSVLVGETAFCFPLSNSANPSFNVLHFTSTGTFGTMAYQNANDVAITGGTITGITPLTISVGGTGSATEEGALTNLGLGTYALSFPNQTSNLSLSNPLSWLTEIEMNSAGHSVTLPSFADANASHRMTIFHNTGTQSFDLKKNDSTTIDTVLAGESVFCFPKSNATNPVFELIHFTGSASLGTMAYQNANSVNITGGTITGITDLAIADGGTGASSATNAVINLGLNNITRVSAGVILDLTLTNPLGTLEAIEMNTSGHSVILPVFNAANSSSRSFTIKNTGTQSFTLKKNDLTTITTVNVGDVIQVFPLTIAANPSFNTVTLSGAIGLGTMAYQNANAVAITGGTITGITDLAVTDGGTGASTATGAQINLGGGGYTVTYTNQLVDLTLTNPIPFLANVQMNASGKVVNLPVFNASSSISREFIIKNSGSQSFTLKDSGGSTIDTVTSGESVIVSPISNASANPGFNLVHISTGSGPSTPPAEIVYVATSGVTYSDIQTAIDSISDASITKPYVVYVYPGIYEITTPITTQAYVTVVGSGVNSTIIHYTASTAGSTDYAYICNTVGSIRDLTIKVDATTHPIGAILDDYGNLIENLSILVTQTGTPATWGIISTSQTGTSVKSCRLQIINNTETAVIYGFYNIGGISDSSLFITTKGASFGTYNSTTGAGQLDADNLYIQIDGNNATTDTLVTGMFRPRSLQNIELRINNTGKIVGIDSPEWDMTNITFRSICNTVFPASLSKAIIQSSNPDLPPLTWSDVNIWYSNTTSQTIGFWDDTGLRDDPKGDLLIFRCTFFGRRGFFLLNRVNTDYISTIEIGEQTASIFNDFSYSNHFINAIYDYLDGQNTYTNMNMIPSSSFKTDILDTNSYTLSAYDVDDGIHRDFITFTAGNTPSMEISAPSGGTSAINNTSVGATTASTGKFTSLQNTSGRIRHINIVTGTGDVFLSSANDILIINRTSPEADFVYLPTAGTVGRQFTIKDGAGVFATYPNTLTPTSGLIDGAASYVMNVNYCSVTVVDDGTNWNVI